MNRMHLIELEDQPWFPSIIRDSMTDHLSFLASRAGLVYRKFSALLADALKQTNDKVLVELCAGGGGPSLALSRHVSDSLGHRPHVVLTDLYPNLARMSLVQEEGQGTVSFIETPVDACNVGPEPAGFRLLFNSFHHLKPDVALACISDAVKHDRGIAIMELVDRSLFGLLQVIFATITVFLFAPFVRPFKWSRLILTYLVPVIPFTIFFDGIVSCLRVYSTKELAKIIASLPPNTYDWNIGTAREAFSPVRITYLVGTPAQSESIRAQSKSNQ